MTAKKRIVTVIVVVIIVCALCGGGFLLYKKFGKSGSSSSEKVYVQKVSAVNTVTGTNLMNNSFAGVVEAQKSVDVKIDTSKTIDEVLVEEGSEVKKGDKLVTYDIESIQIDIDTAKLEVERMENDIKINKTEIQKLEEEKKNVSQDDQYSYNTQILSLESDNARTEYDIKAKKVEITKLEDSMKNAYVTASIDGTVKNLKDIDELQNSDNPDLIMQISADGDYRVKGMFNEQNADDITVGAPVILRSRVDDTEWSGEISEIDTNPQENSNDMYSSGDTDESTTSSKYAFYVTPQSLEGFMLGQHIIIDLDNGSESDIVKTGIWLYSDFVCKDGDKNYVWAKDSNGRIEKRYVEIGDRDEENGDCEIVSGLESGDYIAFPADYIKEGMSATTNQSDVSVPDNDLTVDDEGDGIIDDVGTVDDGEIVEGDSGEEMSFEEMYGITEEELESMTDEEAEEFFNNYYAEQGIDIDTESEVTEDGTQDGETEPVDTDDAAE